MVEKDMSIENFIYSINKLKAAVGAIIWDDPQLIERAKVLYYSNSTIY